MPAMANLVVKKADGTTDITFNQLAAASGDGSRAVWRADSSAPVGLPVGLRQTFSVGSTWNGPKTARRIAFEFAYPYATQDTTTSLYSARDRVVFNQNGATFPAGIPSSVLSEAAAQFSNLMGTQLMKDVMSTGYAPT